MTSHDLRPIYRRKKPWKLKWSHNVILSEIIFLRINTILISGQCISYFVSRLSWKSTTLANIGGHRGLIPLFLPPMPGSMLVIRKKNCRGVGSTSGWTIAHPVFIANNKENSKVIILTSDAGYFLPNIYFYCELWLYLDFLANSYFIVQIYYAKSFKMKYSMSLYLNFSLEYS